jgi:hypothetical protein
MKNIETLKTVLAFSPAQLWYAFLNNLSTTLKVNLLGCNPELEMELDFKSISVKAGHATPESSKESDRISFRVKGSKVGLRILFHYYSEEKGSQVELWFLGEDGCRTGKGDSLRIPRESLGTEEFVTTVSNWFTKLQKPDADLLNGVYL